MTTEERFANVEKELDELRNIQLVGSRMREEWERRWEVRMSDLHEAVLNIASAQVKTQKALDHLIEGIERFVQGRGGNGHSI